VNHSGECGADRIYCGQMMALFNDRKHSPVINEMWNQEKKHLKTFELLVLKHRVRKSYLEPFWSISGIGLGFCTAMISPNAAMACTEAVETVIVDHYNDQIRTLINDDIEYHSDLIKTLSDTRDEEQHHCDTAVHYESHSSSYYQTLFNTISNICHVSIYIAKRF
jgi:3-demethoxyubiquinol 3-hydroxylase